MIHLYDLRGSDCFNSNRMVTLSTSIEAVAGSFTKK